MNSCAPDRAVYSAGVSGRQIQSIGVNEVNPWCTRLWPWHQSRYMFRDGSMNSVPKTSATQSLVKSAPWAASWAHTNMKATAHPPPSPQRNWTHQVSDVKTPHKNAR